MSPFLVSSPNIWSKMLLHPFRQKGVGLSSDPRKKHQEKREAKSKHGPQMKKSMFFFQPLFLDDFAGWAGKAWESGQYIFGRLCKYCFSQWFMVVHGLIPLQKNKTLLLAAWKLQIHCAVNLQLGFTLIWIRSLPVPKRKTLQASIERFDHHGWTPQTLASKHSVLLYRYWMHYGIFVKCLIPCEHRLIDQT